LAKVLNKSNSDGELDQGIYQANTGENAVKSILNDFKTAAFISFWLVFPFMILQLVNRRNFYEEFPFPLFGILLLLPIIFVVILSPIVRNVRAGNNIIANPIIFVRSIAFLALI